MCYDQEKTQAPGCDEGFLKEARAARSRYADTMESAGGIGRAMSSAEILHELFSYHPPTEIALPKFAAIDQAAKNFA